MIKNKLILYFWIFFFYTFCIGLTQAEIKINQVSYLSLKEASRELGCALKTQKPLQLASFSHPKCIIKFEIHKRILFINQLRVYLGYPIALHGHQLCLSKNDFEKTIKPIYQFLTKKYPSPNKQPLIRRILIDPGHGGKDPGAQNKELGLQEKILTLELAKKVKKLLEQSGFDVQLTRQKDYYIGLEERAKKTQEPFKNNTQTYPNLLISLHFNAAQAKEVLGIETYALTPIGQPSTGRTNLNNDDLKNAPGNKIDTQSVCLAFCVQEALAQQMRTQFKVNGKIRDRGVKRARFLILRETPIPSILIEAGFLSNFEEANQLKQPSYLEELAQSITKGITQFVEAS